MRKVFLDCGTNFGQGVSQIGQRYGLGSDWEIYLFEPNPFLRDVIQKNIIDANPGIKIELIPKAVCGKDTPETVQFMIDPSMNVRGGGSSIVSDKFSEKEIVDYVKVDVETVRLADFISHIMIGHDVIQGNTRIFDKSSCFLVVKLDIEGAEFEVLADLLQTGTAWAISDLFIEFHARRFKDKEQKEIEQDFLVSQLYRRGISLFSHS